MKAAGCAIVCVTEPVFRSTIWIPCSRHPHSRRAMKRPSADAAAARGKFPTTLVGDAGSSVTPVESVAIRNALAKCIARSYRLPRQHRPETDGDEPDSGDNLQRLRPGEALDLTADENADGGRQHESRGGAGEYDPFVGRLLR